MDVKVQTEFFLRSPLCAGSAFSVNARKSGSGDVVYSTGYDVIARMQTGANSVVWFMIFRTRCMICAVEQKSGAESDLHRSARVGGLNIDDCPYSFLQPIRPTK